MVQSGQPGAGSSSQAGSGPAGGHDLTPGKGQRSGMQVLNRDITDLIESPNLINNL